MNKKFNPYQVIVAREARRLNQSELALELDIKQAKLSKIEAGLLEIDNDLLEALSNKLNFPINFFYQEVLPLDIELKLHRKKVSLKKKELSCINSYSNIFDMTICKLLNSVEIETNIPKNFDLDEFNSPEDIAIALRDYWGISGGPIHNITELIEKAGIFIAELDYNDDKFDGVSFYSKETTPIMVLNSNLPPDRDRFTKAHEFGHIVMHKIPTANSEDEANKFAAEFLMPEKDIKEELKNLGFHMLPRLKQKWKVSMQALIKRAADLKLINESREKSLWVQVSRAKWRKNEPVLGLPKEKPCLLKQIIDIHIKNLGYSKEDLKQYFALSQDDFDYLYRIESPSIIKIKNDSYLKRVK